MREVKDSAESISDDNNLPKSDERDDLKKNSGSDKPPDGHYFIKVMETEQLQFLANISYFEENLENGENIPDDVRDTILTVIGMAKLLMAQKLTQFRGLCDKNLNLTKEEDPFVPTFQDLAGFWDMVHIQVEQIHNRFDHLKELQKSGWVEKLPEVESKTNIKVKKSISSKPFKPNFTSNVSLARDEARRKLIEDHRRMMKEKSQM